MTGDTAPEFRALALDDAEEAADILAEAFAEDPVMNWMFGNTRVFRTVFRELARGAYLRDGFGHVAAGKAATLWLPAGVPLKLRRLNELRLALAALGHCGPGAIGRAFAAADVMEAHHPEMPHYYLFAVGVAPSAQGKGHGGRIIREGLKRADADGEPAYLESSNPRNDPLYERLGFEAIAPLPMPAGSPRLLGMLRPAGARA
ncbi:MAG: GNAT family N-acetyltransferase [Parvularculaceae bacterium]